eukprot:TRINITY_DN1812_c0_g1_i3.p2 TRINITY_DN1812_c0_g1~~TRINITY_DN1812_c0_g1_i3.p2  ORF type:complete len:134 (+),score=19.19 TRINITY_DN1812_c0_g1_i3:378-779(+)
MNAEAGSTVTTPTQAIQTTVRHPQRCRAAERLTRRSLTRWTFLFQAMGVLPPSPLPPPSPALLLLSLLLRGGVMLVALHLPPPQSPLSSTDRDVAVCTAFLTMDTVFACMQGAGTPGPVVVLVEVTRYCMSIN